jgi:CubicO group peptidase (beta-lactamase class C family)
MESGINFKAIDFVKIGSTLLHGGQWNGGTLVSADWLSRSLVAPAPVEGRIFGYQYMWYSIDNAGNGKDYLMSGRYGQFLYVSPENDTVILRTGTGEGGVDIWPVVLLQLAEATDN